jgi:hypothetical protein
MNRSTQKKTAGVRPENTSKTHQKSRDARQTWKPQPCGISRQEMRQIVLEMIG